MNRYRISSIFAAEIRYVRSLPKMWMGSDYTSRPIAELVAQQMPPGLADKVTHHGCDLDEQDVIDALIEHDQPACDAKGFADKVAAKAATLENIWNAHFRDVPSEIHIHLTNYGSGDSYHPMDRHTLTSLFRGPAITIKEKARKEQPLFILAHETVHLAINAAVEKKFKGIKTDHEQYRIKEAIVDKVLAAEEFRAVGGPFLCREGLVRDLPEDWNTLSCFTKSFVHRDWFFAD